MKRSVVKPIPNGRRGGREAFTRVEILAATAILVAVLGLALGLMLESDRTAREITRQQAGIQYCQAALDEAVRTIQAAVAPTNLGGLQNPKMLEPGFKNDELTLISADPRTTGTFSRVTLGNKPGGPGNRSAGILRRRAALVGDIPATATLAEAIGGPPPDGLDTSIRFGYAAAPRPGDKVDYRDDWTSSALPALVQVTVEARYEKPEPGFADIALQTAVIPGLLPPLRPVAAGAPPLPAGAAETRASNSTTSVGQNVKIITAAPARTLLRPELRNALKEAPKRR